VEAMKLLEDPDQLMQYDEISDIILSQDLEPLDLNDNNHEEDEKEGDQSKEDNWEQLLIDQNVSDNSFLEENIGSKDDEQVVENSKESTNEEILLSSTNQQVQDGGSSEEVVVVEVGGGKIEEEEEEDENIFHDHRQVYFSI